jgi:hypothetical protein
MAEFITRQGGNWNPQMRKKVSGILIRARLGILLALILPAA